MPFIRNIQQMLFLKNQLFIHTLLGDTQGVVSILGGCEVQIQRGGSICGGVNEGLQTTCTAPL